MTNHPTGPLRPDDVEQYWAEGSVLLPDALTGPQLVALKRRLRSLARGEPPTWRAVRGDSAGVDAVAQLIGPNVVFNNSKINSKQLGAATELVQSAQTFEKRTRHAWCR